MNFGKVNASAFEADPSNALPFSPTPAAIKLSKPRNLTNGRTVCERFRVGNLTDNLEVHLADVGKSARARQTDDDSAA